MRDALTPNTFGVWVGQKSRKSAFGGKKNQPGLKAEQEEALLDNQARTDYLVQKQRDEEKEAAAKISLDKMREEAQDDSIIIGEQTNG
jgi:hypothetical protein